jgi:hypothetical protein
MPASEPHSPAYGASKAGLNSLARALAPHGIAAAVLYLASDRAEWASGASPVDPTL